MAVTTRSRAAKESAAAAASIDRCDINPLPLHVLPPTTLLLTRPLLLLQMIHIPVLIIASAPLSVVGQEIQP